jgi:hypothetical protein
MTLWLSFLREAKHAQCRLPRSGRPYPARDLRRADAAGVSQPAVSKRLSKATSNPTTERREQACQGAHYGWQRFLGALERVLGEENA